MTILQFREHFQGAFTNMLRWPQLRQLWTVVQNSPEGWYIYCVGQELPTQPVQVAELQRFIQEIDELLHREHEHDYCGIVYADNPEAPQMVKIFDPNNLGVVCGPSKGTVLPGWILSRIPPQSLDNPGILPENRKRWWQRLFPS